MTRLRYSDEALKDLHDIHSYIAQDSLDRADAVIARIERRLEALRKTPNLGHRRLEFGANIRTVPVKPFVVFYRLTDEARTIEIARVIDGRRDLGTVFFSPLVAAAA